MCMLLTETEVPQTTPQNHNGCSIGSVLFQGLCCWKRDSENPDKTDSCFWCVDEISLWIEKVIHMIFLTLLQVLSLLSPSNPGLPIVISAFDGLSFLLLSSASSSRFYPMPKFSLSTNFCLC